jgi:hypothetical protein
MIIRFVLFLFSVRDLHAPRHHHGVHVRGDHGRDYRSLHNLQTQLLLTVEILLL